MKRVLAVLLLAAPALAENTTDLPCTALPPTAVSAVPAPFDSYMDLVCTHAGQALRPKPGNLFLRPDGAMYLTALNAETPKVINEAVHFTALTSDPLSETELASLRADLHKIMDGPIDQSQIIRMREETSTGASKQIYLLLPPEGAKGGVLGMECNHDCRPIESDPWFFTIVKEKG